MKLGRMLRRLRTHVKVYYFLFKDRRTPRISKILLLFAVGYILLPFDIIPDYIPFAGFLDELIIIPIIFYIVTMFIPKNVVEENRNKAKGIKSKFEDAQEGVIVE